MTFYQQNYHISVLELLLQMQAKSLLRLMIIMIINSINGKNNHTLNRQNNLHNNFNDEDKDDNNDDNNHNHNFQIHFRNIWSQLVPAIYSHSYKPHSFKITIYWISP